MKKEFQHPICIGIITKCAKNKEAKRLKRRLEADLKNTKEIALLLLETPLKRLAAVKKCMILMDIPCAFVSSEYVKKVLTIADKLDATAKGAKMANLLTLQKKKLVASFVHEFFDVKR